MDNRPGWFAMKHGVSRHPLLRGNPERIAIWVWLVDNAAFKDVPHDINGKTITVRRGQVAISQRRLAEETGVGRQVIRTFLERLRTERMINPDVTHGKTVVTLCNYEKYQAAINAPNPAPNPAVTHDQPTNKQINNIPVGKAAPSEAEIVVFEGVKATLWKVARSYLSRFSEKDPGSIIGKWIKTAGGSATKVLEAIEMAEKSQTEDPIPYITKILSGQTSSFSKQRSGPIPTYLQVHEKSIRESCQ